MSQSVVIGQPETKPNGRYAADDLEVATYEDFLAKPPREQRYKMRFTEGGPFKIVLLRAIGRPEYDNLAAKHPAKDEDLARQSNVHLDTFVPELLARVVAEPSVSPENWRQVWKADNWSTGEIGSLYSAANNLCARGLDLDPFGGG